MKSYWLYPPVGEGLLNFLVISMSLAAAIEIFGNKVFPGFAFFGWLLSVLLFFMQRLNLLFIKDDFLHLVSVQKEVGSVKWNLRELDILGAREFDVSSPERLQELSRKPAIKRKYGFTKLENGEPAFHFVAKSKVPLVLIPIKKGGYILLSLKDPKDFLRALSAHSIANNFL
jgi:hypothetical protein